MATVVAALIAAAFALLVAVVERYLVAREERRKWELADRRAVYARFDAAVSRLLLMVQRRDEVDPAQRSTVEEAFLLALGEVNLVGAPQVHRAAFALYVALAGADPHREDWEEAWRLAHSFLFEARRDLGYPVE